MRKKWLVLLCLLFLCIGGGALWICSARQSDTTQSLLLPDSNSNRVHLVAVTVGTNAKVSFGTPLERVLARLPGKLGSRFKANEVSALSYMSSGDDIVFWFRYDRVPQSGTYLRAHIIEEGEQRRVPMFSSHPRTLSNGVTVAHSGTHLWPRRNRTLTFRVEQARQSHESVEVGELTVANPAYRRYPIWAPEQLPATRNFKDASFALESLGRSPPAPRETRVRVMSDGEADTSWEVWAHWSRDATGNSIARRDEPHSAPVRHKPDGRGVIALPTLWRGMPKEPAWKVGFRFVRTGSLASNEVFVLRGVPAILTGSWFSTTWQTNLAAGVVQFRHHLDWGDGSSRRPCLVSYLPDIGDSTDPKPNLAFAILDAVNDAGQRIAAVDGRKIHIPTGSSTLDITIGIPPQYCVEYTVDPAAFDEWTSIPAYLKPPDSIRPEKILRDPSK